MQARGQRAAAVAAPPRRVSSLRHTVRAAGCSARCRAFVCAHTASVQQVAPTQACRLSAALPPRLPAPRTCSTQRRRAGASCSSTVQTSVPRADVRARVWLKPTHLIDAPYVEVAGVDVEWPVARLCVHVLAVLRLRGVVPVQTTLRLVARCGGKPDAAAERAAARLEDESATLAAAGVADGAWLLADVRSGTARAAVVRDVTLLTDMLVAPTRKRYCVPQLCEELLRDLLFQHNAVALVETLDADAPLLRTLDQLRHGMTYYLCPAASSAVGEEVRLYLPTFCVHKRLLTYSRQVDKLREDANGVAAALANEAAECVRHALQRRQQHVERLSAKVFVPCGSDRFELDAVVLADSCAAVVQAKTVLNESAAAQLLRNVNILKCVHLRLRCLCPRIHRPHALTRRLLGFVRRSELKDAPDCPPELRMFAGKRIVSVLAGGIIKPLTPQLTAEQLVQQWRAAGIALLLPSRAGLGFHDDGCLQGAPFDAA